MIFKLIYSIGIAWAIITGLQSYYILATATGAGALEKTVYGGALALSLLILMGLIYLIVV